MYDYVTTKPELNEETLSEFGITIQHGYLKDAAAKTHKYLKRWKNAAGKWVYQYKVKAKRKLKDFDPEDVSSSKAGTYGYDWSKNGFVGIGDGRSRTTNYLVKNKKGYSTYNSATNYDNGSVGLNRGIKGIEAGRKRAAERRARRSSVNSLRNRGYSKSMSDANGAFGYRNIKGEKKYQLDYSKANRSTDHTLMTKGITKAANERASKNRVIKKRKHK